MLALLLGHCPFLRSSLCAFESSYHLRLYTRRTEKGVASFLDYRSISGFLKKPGFYLLRRELLQCRLGASRARQGAQIQPAQQFHGDRPLGVPEDETRIKLLRTGWIEKTSQVRTLFFARSG